MRLCLLLLPLCACDLFPTDDDTAGGDPAVAVSSGGSVARLLGGDEGVSTAWTATVATAGAASLGSDGTDVWIGVGDQVQAFALADGTALWNWGAPSLVYGLAGPEQGVLLVLAEDALLGLDAGTGEQLWILDFIDLPGVSLEAVAAGGGAGYLGGDPIRRISLADGTVNAIVATGSSAVSQVEFTNEGLYAALEDGVALYDPANLGMRWQHPTGAEVDHLAPSAGAIAYSVLGGGVGTLTSGGNPIWEAQDGELIDSLAASGDLVLVGRSDGTLFGIDAGTGTELWTAPARATPVRSMVVSGSTLFVADGGFVEGLNAADGSELWEWTPQGNPLALIGQ